MIVGLEQKYGKSGVNVNVQRASAESWNQSLLHFTGLELFMRGVPVVWGDDGRGGRTWSPMEDMRPSGQNVE